MKTELPAIVALALLSACQQQPAEAKKDGSGVAGLPRNGVMLAVAAPTRAQALKLMHDRHENMEKIRDAVKAASAELKGRSPNLNVVRRSAATIAGFAPKIPSWFPPGTGPDVGKTMAKAEIWQKPQDFTAKWRAFNQVAYAFDAAAKAGDMNAIHASFGELGKSCKACHDRYRAEHKD